MSLQGLQAALAVQFAAHGQTRANAGVTGEPPVSGDPTPAAQQGLSEAQAGWDGYVQGRGAGTVDPTNLTGESSVPAYSSGNAEGQTSWDSYISNRLASPEWVPDIQAASVNPNINVDLGSLGGTVPFPPTTENGTHPLGGLTAEGNTVTTAGGYEIEMLSKFEWKITGPDGNHTRIWGDPHVDEGDGGKWDFKRNSTFVLGDGTQIHCTTVPWGNKGMTVTGSLEIVSGNERVMVTDIDQGRGKVGDVTQDGYSRASHMFDDVFVMGQESDDWALHGHEVIGHRNGGESHKTADKLMILGYGDWNVAENRFFRGFHGHADPLDSQQFRAYWSEIAAGGDGSGIPTFDDRPPFANNAYAASGAWGRADSSAYDSTLHRDTLDTSFSYISNMVGIVNEMTALRDQALAHRVIY